MAEITPAVLPKNYEDLKNKISLVRGLAPVVQVDICDGVFVKNITWPFEGRGKNLGNLSSRGSHSGGEGRRDEEFQDFSLDQHFIRILNEQEGMPFWEDIDFELDLMVSDAVENFDIYTKLGPRRIIFHLEAVSEQEEFQDFLEGIDTYIREAIQIGVAIGPLTPIEKIFPLIDSIDFVQCMGIDHEGIQGEEFDPRCLEQIKKLKAKFPDIVISVDGGVNLETAPEIIAAGADRLVAGSAIFNTDDIIDTIERFKNL